jgi:hypothetical protein
LKLRIEEIPLGSPRMKHFIAFPWKLYRGDPCWTPPLKGDLAGNRLLGLTGILTPEHPYHKHAEVTHFLAWQGRQVVGRISAAINYKFNDHYNTRIGSFGFFEVINDYEVAGALLDSARKWVEERGMEILRGPGEYSNATHERQGILIEGFEYPPTVECTHNPPYYAELIEQYGLRKTKDYCAHTVDRDTAAISLIRRLAKKVSKKNLHLETRMLNDKKLKDEVNLILTIYNKAWANNWGFLPITNEEGDAIADSLRIIEDPGLIRFAFVKDEPVGVLGIIPDPYYALRPRWRWYGDSDFIRVSRLLLTRKNIPRTRAMFFGIIPEYQVSGIPALLTWEVVEYLLQHQYFSCEGSLLLEDNDKILKVVELFGGKRYKTWRIYDLQLK